MKSPYFVQNTSLALNISAIISLVTAITGILFFTVGKPFGTITDASSVFQMLSLIFVAFTLYYLLRSEAATISLVATTIGILGMLVVAVLQTLLVLDIFTYEQVTIGVTLASGGIGIWLILQNIVALRGKLYKTAICWIGIVVGVGYLLFVVGFFTGGLESLVFGIGASIVYYVYPVWAFWLARAIKSVVQEAVRIAI